ncbi:nitrite reductase large subunit NirB [Xanthomonas translucens]|uniref:nitrite reductase large subunit NirB n=1 Tax=Xanthomonas campestris pv. translucens TaxID=343 RepID=UPI001E37C4DF|nr:nitrite reductase large subunit NirB [Xanthomonas translucens]MCT8283346.1 nitrite reductase large subunit NirB [Xanthomonas translucens pv. undulosa]MCT8318166.1 nitrite reductase large subunit NirB [Xanthomonas translucens pv. undulosa]UII66243.1 nitrite reductase large subunit NirB [Xanthomonas translucens]UJB16964.1 nitrite reductase large subunit NirB [Xanthomonas translucens pv. undulosa]UPU50949.1 nitrite reductase large subunit NirB [Xanthomonas translucens pv. undulosa]
MAGIRTVEELLKLMPGMYDITVFGAEPHPNYNRILLSPVLSGEQQFDEIVLNPLAWYAEHGIHLHVGKEVTRIDRVKRKVIAADGTEAPYDRLLLATGSLPIVLPVPGKDLKGVIGYRDMHDTQTMIDTATRKRHAVVIGGGLLGLEAANGLKQRGMQVTVVHLADWLLERQLDPVAGQLLQRSLSERGLEFRLGTSTTELVGNADGDVVAVKFSDGSEVPADLVVMAAGIRPNIALAQAAGIHCTRGIVVNDTLQTFDPRVYAVGECASHRGIAYGLVAPLFEQAKICANHLAGFGIGIYRGSVASTKLKVTGIDLFSAGDFMGGEGSEEIVLSDPAGGVYKKLVLKDDKLVGACLYGDTNDGAWYFQLLKDASPIGERRERLMFGESALGDAGTAGQDRASAMRDSDEVCGCNGVCKGTIVKAINAQGLFTVDEVKKQTKAASSCGSCTGLVEQILMNCLGSNFQQTPKTKAVCGCTDLNHGEVRKAIGEGRLLTHGAVYTQLQWRSPNGCATCRPAINYYLLSTWPREAVDDPQSRFINERAHANIQKDGTFSVIPQMKGGVTNASELRRIADVADKYAVPMVKVTGGQRIDLLGIRKEDLVGVWKDLGMNSGHAYGKSIRTVKTCVGSEFCRFGTQNSTQMGIELETMLANMWSPHKVKLAVSGCPRNCAESGIKDVGIIAVESGWELHIGGNGGMKTEVAKFLVKVKTAEEVKEYTGAFLQLYREEAYYLDRTVHYIERVGMDYIRQRVIEDAANRRALYERLLYALEGLPDPWAERIAGARQREFQPLRVAAPLALVED